MSLGKTNQHRKPGETATNTTMCLKFWNYFASRKWRSMLTAEGGQQDLPCFSSPRWFPALSSYFPHQTDLLPFPSEHTGPVSPRPCSNLNLSLPSNLFFFSPTAPSKMIFFLPPRKFILPCYLIILCNSMPNSLSFSHWGYVLKKTKWSVLVLTYCRLPGIENTTVFALRKIPPNSGLCAHKAGKQTSPEEQHLTPTPLLSG